uniref:IlGF domain-containing protein n=1 Tax=Heligmosomoides polygyrus TaxID=6339 RepID=A0A183FRI5_HELPZ
LEALFSLKTLYFTPFAVMFRGISPASPLSLLLEHVSFLSDRFNAAYHPKCSNGREPYGEMMDGWRQIRFGKSCADNFCPSGYRCQDADIFAYCC